MKKVIVNRTTYYNRYGEMRLKATPEKLYGVVCQYQGGKVKTASGDVWVVKPYSGYGADFIVDEPAS